MGGENVGGCETWACGGGCETWLDVCPEEGDILLKPALAAWNDLTGAAVVGGGDESCWLLDVTLLLLELLLWLIDDIELWTLFLGLLLNWLVDVVDAWVDEAVCKNCGFILSLPLVFPGRVV